MFLLRAPGLFEIQGELWQIFIFLLCKTSFIENYSLGICVFTESRPGFIQITGGIMANFYFFVM